MIVKISGSEVVFGPWVGTIQAHASEAFVQPGFVVLEILEDALSGALFCLWCQRLKADVLQSDTGTLKWNLHVCDVILEV